jgi:hypothetical protein
MIKKLLRPVLSIGISVALTGTAFFALGMWRRAADTEWCKNAAAGDTVTSDLLEAQRSACSVQRQRQRTMFGSVWRRGGQTAAECGFELARLQLLGEQDPKVAPPILARYGIDPSGFEASDRSDQNRFTNACVAHDRQATP